MYGESKLLRKCCFQCCGIASAFFLILRYAVHSAYKVLSRHTYGILFLSIADLMRLNAVLFWSLAYSSTQHIRHVSTIRYIAEASQVHLVHCRPKICIKFDRILWDWYTNIFCPKRILAKILVKCHALHMSKNLANYHHFGGLKMPYLGLCHSTSFFFFSILTQVKVPTAISDINKTCKIQLLFNANKFHQIYEWNLVVFDSNTRLSFSIVLERFLDGGQLGRQVQCKRNYRHENS